VRRARSISPRGGLVHAWGAAVTGAFRRERLPSAGTVRRRQRPDLRSGSSRAALLSSRPAGGERARDTMLDGLVASLRAAARSGARSFVIPKRCRHRDSRTMVAVDRRRCSSTSRSVRVVRQAPIVFASARGDAE
jgi:hypothetical protein